jgi:hypothetical protein
MISSMAMLPDQPRVTAASMVQTLPGTGRLALGAAIAAVWARGVVKKEKEAKELAQVEWKGAADEVEVAGDDACVIIGEEKAKQGRWWFLCSSKPDDPALDCKQDDSMQAGAEEAWLCKTPKTKTGVRATLLNAVFRRSQKTGADSQDQEEET